jgi:hypothetical protein
MPHKRREASEQSGLYVISGPDGAWLTINVSGPGGDWTTADSYFPVFTSAEKAGAYLASDKGGRLADGSRVEEPRRGEFLSALTKLRGKVSSVAFDPPADYNEVLCLSISGLLDGLEENLVLSAQDVLGAKRLATARRLPDEIETGPTSPKRKKARKPKGK